MVYYIELFLIVEIILFYHYIHQLILIENDHLMELFLIVLIQILLLFRFFHYDHHVIAHFLVVVEEYNRYKVTIEQLKNIS
jgi:hypothetical protein